MKLDSYKEKIRTLSDRIVEAQKPIRILDSIKWPDSVETSVVASDGKEMPKIDKAYYEKHLPLGYEPTVKMAEFSVLIRDIKKELGPKDELGKILTNTAEEYHDVVAMLAARGTKKFYEYSCKLYGSPRDPFFDNVTTSEKLALLLKRIFVRLDETAIGPPKKKDIPAREAVRILKSRFDKSFLNGCVEVKLSDGIVADAAAGSSYVKIRQDAFFSQRDIDLLEVHEGWTHVATSVNGSLQTTARWMAKGPPRCTMTQEGLALLMEVITFRSYPHRANKVIDRILGVVKAEQGADALELYRFYRDDGLTEHESYRAMMRVCRGGLVTGGAPFTKDISYAGGFIKNYNFIRIAIRRGRPELVRFLFCGKLNVEDIPLLYSRHLEGIVDAPVYLPPPFVDLSGLAVWMSFSNYLNEVDLQTVRDKYEDLFKKYL